MPTSSAPQRDRTLAHVRTQVVVVSLEAVARDAELLRERVQLPKPASLTIWHQCSNGRSTSGCSRSLSTRTATGGASSPPERVEVRGSGVSRSPDGGGDGGAAGRLAALLERREAIQAGVRALAEPAPAGVVLVARGSSDNAPIFGRYLLEPADGRPVALAAPSLLTLYDARVDCRGWLAIGLSQAGATPEIVDVFARRGRRSSPSCGRSSSRARLTLARGLDPDAPPGLSKVTPT